MKSWDLVDTSSEKTLTKLFFALDCPAAATKGISNGYDNQPAVVAFRDGVFRVMQGPAVGPSIGKTFSEAKRTLKEMANN